MRNIHQPKRKCCPQCDNLGFKRVYDNWTRGTMLRCNYCGHEWERQGHVDVSDRRHVVHHEAGEQA